MSDQLEFGWDGSLLASQLQVTCLNDQQKKLLKAAGYDLTTNKSWLPFNGSVDATASDRDVSVAGGKIPSECVYQMGVININSIGYFLGDFLNGTITAGSYSYDYQGPMALQAIFHEGNMTFQLIDETWRNMSDAITWYMRQNGETNLSQPALGEAWRVQTCVSIRWPFLIYPAILVLLTILFFAVMLFDTRRREVSRHDWKSSSLPLMFHGLDRRTAHNSGLAAITKVKEMEMISNHTKVRLTQTGSGWRFMGAGVGS